MNPLLLMLLTGSIGGIGAAAVARAILPGKQMVSGLEMMVIGTAAGFVAGLLGQLLGFDDGEGWKRFIPFFVAVGISAVAIYLWTGFRNRQVKDLLVPDAVEDSIAKTKTAVDQTTQKMTNTVTSATAPDLGKPKRGIDDSNQTKR